MSTTIRLGPGVELPLDLVTEAVAILARRGAGKSTAAKVAAEQMIGAGQCVVVLDPTGAWWGLRAAADGEHPGLPVLVVGGDHGDIPLDPAAGARLAELVVRERIPMVLDLSHLSKTAMRRFSAEFLEVLYRLNREPLHIVADEADVFAPQRAQAESARVLGAMQDVVQRGRKRGLGCTLITQRPAVLNKDVLSQCSVLIVLQMTGAHDIAAIDDWVRHQGDPDAAAQVKASLPKLQVGHGWVWSPGLDLLVQVQVDRPITFDSSATPKVGQTLVEPRQLAAVDVERIAGLLTPDEVPAGEPDDKTELQRMLADLRRQVREAEDRPPVRVEVPVVSDEAREALGKLVATMAETGQALARIAERIGTALGAVSHDTVQASPAMAAAMVSAGRAAEGAARRAGEAVARKMAPTPTKLTDGNGLKAGARRMLHVALDNYPMDLTVAQLARQAKMTPSSGTFTTYLGEMKRRGLVEAQQDGKLRPTKAALSDAGIDPDVPADPQAAWERWRPVLRGKAGDMFVHLLSCRDGYDTRVAIADAVGLVATSGTYSTYLGQLRTAGLILTAGDWVKVADPYQVLIRG